MSRGALRGSASGLLGMFIQHPMIWGVVAEVDGRIVGSNFLDERSPIRGVGPITVAPEGQDSGVGRKLMQAVLERGEGAPGIRLLQDAFHMRSLCLYESLGFDVKEPVALASGKPRGLPDSAVEVRLYWQRWRFTTPSLDRLTEVVVAAAWRGCGVGRMLLEL
jgi:GNAT superfamily N-acetyltransferase